MAKTILRNANVVDGRRPGYRATVTIAGDRIESVAAGSDTGNIASGEVRVIDLNGRTVMPGMVLGHFHGTYKDLGQVPSPFGLEAPAALQALRAASNFRLALDCGFTGVISAGSPNAVDAAMKSAIAEGTAAGPRIMACGRDVSTTGHLNHTSFPSYWQIGATGGVLACDGPEGFRRAVRQEVMDGSDIIKVFATGGHGVPSPAERWDVTPEELDMAVRTAEQRGAKIRAHLANRDAILCAIELGVHIVDHGDGFDDACIDAAVKKGTFLAPSLLFPKVMMQVAAGSALAEGMRDGFEKMAAILARADAAGVKIILGDDYGAYGFPHGLYADELPLYVEVAGVDPLTVIRWATCNGAAAMGLEGVCGEIAPGFQADLLVIDGDPLADIGILRDRENLLAIYKAGVAHKDELANLPAA